MLSFWDKIKHYSGFGKTVPEKLAKAEFKKQFPDDRLVWTGLAEIKQEEYIVGITYWDDSYKIPPDYRFFSVRIDTKEVKYLPGYAPEGWFDNYL